MTHIRDVLCGKKKVVRKQLVSKVNLPKGIEYCTDTIYNIVKANPSYLCYIPWFDEGKYQAKDALSRDWLVGLINALDNNFFPRLVAYHEG